MILCRIVRESQGLTLENLSDATGVHYSTLSRIEKGHIKPTLQRATVIADALSWVGNPIWLFQDVSDL